MKLSLVTVVYNAQDTIRQCIQSVISQNYPNLEYIIIDGGSTDNTLAIIQEYHEHIHVLISKPDQGIYDAMNKGIRLATGDVVGMLNADDQFAGDDVLQAVAGVFTQQDTEIVYGDLDIMDQYRRVIRKWRSGQYNRNAFKLGFMPPHPTFYCRRNLFDQFGYYRIDHGSAADYELMLRLMYRHGVRSYHLKQVMVNMRTGGISSKNWKNRLKAWQYDLLAMRQNKLPFPILTLVLKPLRKILQFL